MYRRDYTTDSILQILEFMSFQTYLGPNICSAASQLLHFGQVA